MKKVWGLVMNGIVCAGIFAVLSNVSIDPVYGFARLYPAWILLAAASYFLGPIGGCAVGGLGLLGSLLIRYYWDWQMLGRLLPNELSQVLAAAAAGLTLGLLCKWTKVWEQTLTRLLLSACAVVVAAAVGYLLVNPMVFFALRGYSFRRIPERYTDEFVANGVMMLLGILLAVPFHAILQKARPAADRESAGAADEHTMNSRQ